MSRRYPRPDQGNQPPLGWRDHAQSRGRELVQVLAGQVEEQHLQRRVVADQHHAVHAVGHLAETLVKIVLVEGVEAVLESHLGGVHACLDALPGVHRAAGVEHSTKSTCVP